MKILAVIAFAAGLLIAGSEGPYFPYANMGGVVLMFVGVVFIHKLHARGLL